MGVGFRFGGAAVAAALVMTGSPSASAEVPVRTDDVFIIPGANADAWAPDILEPLDPWSNDGRLTHHINAGYYNCSGCTPTTIRYPRSGGPLFGPGAPSADESVAIAVDKVLAELAQADGPSVISALSLGAVASDAVQRALDARADRPSPSQVTFIVAGDPTRVTPLTTGIGSLMPVGPRLPVFGWTVTRPPSESEYDTVVVVGEYEWAADFPDRPWNLLADLNSLAGFAYNHSEASLTRPADVPPQNIVTTVNGAGATTTTYLIPSPEVPLLKPFDGILAPPVIEAANNVLKPIIDRGYSRYDAVTGNQMPYLQPTDSFPRLAPPKNGASAPSGTADARPRHPSASVTDAGPSAGPSAGPAEQVSPAASRTPGHTPRPRPAAARRA